VSTPTTFTKAELVELATTHHDREVRRCAAESIYTLGVKDGGAQMIAARERALASASIVTPAVQS
jgi:hypothetical protein